jgi:hypothetical protein
MVTLPAGPTYFSLLHSVQTDSGAHTVCYPMGTGGFFPDWVMCGDDVFGMPERRTWLSHFASTLCTRYKEQEVLGRTNGLLSFDPTRIPSKTTRPAILPFVCSLPRERVYRAVA